MPRALIHHAEVLRVCFSALSAEEIERLSVAEITDPRLYQGGVPVKGGPNDPRMGIIKGGQRCETCF